MLTPGLFFDMLALLEPAQDSVRKEVLIDGDTYDRYGD